MFDGAGSSVWTDEQIANPYTAEGSTGFVSSHVRPPAWAAIDATLRSYTQLPPGWDGDGAVVPSNSAIEDARRYFSLLLQSNATPPDRVLPSFRGTIVAEWQDGASYREAEFLGNCIIEIMSQTHASAPFEHSIEHLQQLDLRVRRARAVKSSIWVDGRDSQLSTTIAA